MKNESKKMTKLVAAMLVGTVGVGLYSASAAGLTGSYVGIGTAPTDSTVVKSGTEYNADNLVGKNVLIDYRQTKRMNGEQEQDFSRIPTNDNKNGEGVDGTATANDSRAGVGTTAIGLGTYSTREYSTAVGTYTSAIMGSTSVGSGAFATQYGSAFGRNTYANNKAVAVGEAARAADGIAIGIGASAGQFYKYIQNDGRQNRDSIQYSIAIGPNATAVGGTAIGAKAKTNGLYGVALGQSSSVAYNGVALGVRAQVTREGNGGVALGTYSVANRGAGSIGYMPLVDGVKGEIAADNATLAGYMGLSDTIKNFETTYKAQIEKYNELNKAYNDASSAEAVQKQIMLETKGHDDVAYKAAEAEYKRLSNEAVAATNARNAWTAANKDFTAALAEYESALAPFKATDGAVSVGSTSYVDAKTGQKYQNTRQIINVAAGTEDTDAVNVAQLKAVEKVTADKMSSFTVGDGKKAADGEEAPATLTVDGEKTHFDIVGANGNITTTVDSDGRAIQIGLSNTLDLGKDGSISVGASPVKVDGNGLTIKDGPSMTNNGIDAGNKTITNVKSDIAEKDGADYLAKLENANTANPNSAVNVSDLQSTADTLNNKITQTGNDITTVNTNIGKLQDGFKVSAGSVTSDVKLGGDTVPTITFAGDSNVTAELDATNNTVTYKLNKDGIVGTLGDAFTKIDASNLTGDTNINNWKTKLGITATELGQASAWKLQANGANESVIEKDSLVNFVNGTGTEVSKTGTNISVGLDKATQDKINNASGDVTKLQAGFKVAAGANTSEVKLGGDTVPTITFAGDSNVTAELDATNNTVTYKLNKDGIVGTLGDAFTKIDASNLQGDTTNINNWKTVLGVTEDNLKNASAWKLQANGKNETTISKDTVVNFVNGTGTEISKTDNTITVGLDDTTNTKINNITNVTGDVTKLKAGFDIKAGTTTSNIALGGDKPTITFAGDSNLTAELDANTNTVTYKLNKDGIVGTLGDTFTKIDGSNLENINVNNWRTALNLTDAQLGQASAWKLQANGATESVIEKDSVVNFVNGTGTEVTKDGNTIKVGLDEATNTKINNISNVVNKDGKLNIVGDTATGVKVEQVDPNNATKGVKVSLDDKISVGGEDGVVIGKQKVTPKTADGTGELAEKEGKYITGLENTSWNPEVNGIVEDRAATEGQLRDVANKINEVGESIGNGDRKFAGDSGTATAKLGSEISMTGGAKADNLTNGNIGVVANGSNLSIQLSKDLTGLNSVTTKELTTEKATIGDLNVNNSITVGNGDNQTVINNDGISIKGKDGKDGVSISGEGIDMGGKTITNVGEATNPGDAISKGQFDRELSEVVGSVNDGMGQMNNRMNKLDNRMNKVGAGAAALAGLHPLEFNPDDKFSAAVAMGSYKGQGAAALGGFYRPNADTMFSVSSTLGDETMFNIGLSLKFGDKGDDIYRNPNDTSFRALTNEVASLKEENKALNDKMAEKEKSFEATNKELTDRLTAQQVELEQQRALIQQLMAKVGM